MAPVVLAEVAAEEQEAAAPVQDNKALMDKEPDTEIQALQVAWDTTQVVAVALVQLVVLQLVE